MKKKFKQPEGLEPGIYFNLSNEDYHNDPALSHGGMVYCLESFYDYWINSPLNPDRTKKSTDAMIEGDRKHQLLLDPKSFFEEYSVTGSGWQQGKKLINRSDFERIKESIEEIKNVPEAFSYFQAGMPEVSIIMVDPGSGLRLRARIDYLRTFGGIDYKTCRTLQNNALGYFISENGYDIQQELYQQLIGMAKILLQQGTLKIFGNYDPDWLKKFMDTPETLFRFLFQRSTRPYIFKIKKLDDEILNNARAHIEDAKRIYKRNIETFGRTRPPGGDGKVTTFNIYHMPRRIIDRGDHNFDGE